jgi:hypothetical protein
MVKMIRTQDLQDRLQRADSWIKAARKLEPDSLHAAFVFYYIAFNSLYGLRLYEGTKTEADQDLKAFLRRIKILHDLDIRNGSRILPQAIQACCESGGDLIKDFIPTNRYWKRIAKAADIFNSQDTEAVDSARKGQYEDFLRLVLQRLNVLRNQVFHGCVTYGAASKGVPTLKAGLAVLKEVVPSFYKLMDEYGDYAKWPPIPYPRLGSEAHPRIDEVS